MGNDLVSIVLPVYNGEKYLSESIDSVIAQSYQNWELIIIDDCSSDNSSDIAKDYAARDSRIHYYRNEQNLKLPRSLNRGFSFAKGDYLTWTSDDNLYLPEAIEQMVNASIKENADFVFASCHVIDENGKIVDIWTAPKDYKTAIMAGDFVGACFLYTRAVYTTVGDYDETRFLTEDYDYWLRIFYRFNVYHITDCLYKYRWHDGALTSTEKKDRINSVCEKVLIDNIRNYGKLTLKQKYYYYAQLNRLRKTKESKKEKKKYSLKYKLLYIYYFPIYVLPKKIKNRIGKIFMHPIRSLIERQKGYVFTNFSKSKYSKRLKKFKNIHKGETCFIIGNGPSLRAEDLQEINQKNLHSFAFNRIYLMFDKTDWRPTYYVSQDEKTLKNCTNEVNQMDLKYKFIPLFIKYYHDIDIKNAIMFHLISSNTEYPKMSDDISKYIGDSTTVAVTAAQMAVYMGFKRIYLIGVDHNFSTWKNDKGEIIKDLSVKDYFTDKYNKDKAELYVPNVDASTRAFISLMKFCNVKGVEVYNATRGGKLEVFPRVDFDEAIKEL